MEVWQCWESAGGREVWQCWESAGGREVWQCWKLTRESRQCWQSAGNPNNAGNVKIGAVKKRAAKRSGVRRSAKRALVIKKKWLDLILDGRKTWEIRGSSTAKRGWVHLAESKAGGKLVGRAKLVASFPLSRSSFMKNYSKHRVSSLNTVPYETPHAWVFADAEKFQRPFVYEHKQGAVVWVDV